MKIQVIGSCFIVFVKLKFEFLHETVPHNNLKWLLNWVFPPHLDEQFLFFPIKLCCNNYLFRTFSKSFYFNFKILYVINNFTNRSTNIIELFCYMNKSILKSEDQFYQNLKTVMVKCYHLLLFNYFHNIQRHHIFSVHRYQ